MSEPAPATGMRSTSWRTVNVVLVVLALLLAGTAVLLGVRNADAAGGGGTARDLSTEYAAVTASAKAETLAFLTVDYKNMDPLIAKVLAGAAGSFKTQYSGARENLKTSAQQAQAVSTGKVLSVGISDIDAKNAVVFVAADSQVTNRSTKGKAQPRYYRLKLSMVKQGSAWRTSDLQFVG